MGPGAAGRIVEPARAKINLCLHVLGRRGDGNHELESLVAFADIGDVVTAAASRTDAFRLTGPFGPSLAGRSDNLVLAAREAARGPLALPPLDIMLDKRLPVASGIGGGSADAAAMLRIAARLGGRDAASLAPLAAGLGADVPVCLFSGPAWMSGIGEAVAPLAAFPATPVVLVNPGLEAPTTAVFAELGLKRGTATMRAGRRPDAFAGTDALTEFLSATRNDLEAAACRLVPAIAEVLAALRGRRGCLLARMSGSGATCFGLFADDKAAGKAAEHIAAERPGWWTASGRLEAA